MRKVGIIVIVALLAISGIMAAMAYTTARVDNDFSLTIVNSSDALLALTPSAAHNAAYLRSTGVMVVNLDLGFGNQPFGLQRDSEYYWEDLFRVTNNSENDVDVTINMVDHNFGGTPSVYVRSDDADWTYAAGHKINHTGASGLKQYTFELLAGESKDIDMRIVSSNNAKGSKIGNLEISAVAK